MKKLTALFILAGLIPACTFAEITSPMIDSASKIGTNKVVQVLSSSTTDIPSANCMRTNVAALTNQIQILSNDVTSVSNGYSSADTIVSNAFGAADTVVSNAIDIKINAKANATNCTVLGITVNGTNTLVGLTNSADNIKWVYTGGVLTFTEVYNNVTNTYNCFNN
jgi:hypothetical protein